MSILSQLKQSQNTDFPNLRPSLDLRFALAKKLDPRITFTRGSTGTYFGSDGLMRTAGVNEPRFDHDPVTGQSLGLLIEESRSNLVTYSEDFSNATWSKGNLSVLPNTSLTLSPDGTATAETFYAATTGGSNVTHAVTGSYTGLTPNASYTFSVFVKKAQTKYMALGSWDGVAGLDVYFNIEDGTILSKSASLTSVTITPYFGGWYRVSSTRTISSTTLVPVIYVNRSSDGNVLYQGEGSSIYAWGAQLEAGALPTSYIPTTASTVTRSTDLASMTGTNFSSWYNQSEGTIYLETDKLYPGNFDAYRHPYKIDSGSNADQITAYVGPGGTIITNYGIVTGGRQVNDYQQINIGSSPIRYKLGQSVSSKYFFFTTSTGRVPPQLPSKSAPNTHNLSLATNMSRLFIGNNAGGGQINSHISRLTYYPIQLTNQQLVNLTS
jgi:hypothetical protein